VHIRCSEWLAGYDRNKHATSSFRAELVRTAHFRGMVGPSIPGRSGNGDELP